MADISPDAQAALRAMSDQEFSAFCSQLRPPDRREEFRQHAAQFVTDPAALDALSNNVDLGQFVGADGNVDPERVAGHLTALFGATPSQPQPQQRQAKPAFGTVRGEAGKAAAAKRFGLNQPPTGDLPPPGQGRQPGSGGLEEITRRFGAK